MAIGAQTSDYRDRPTTEGRGMMSPNEQCATSQVPNASQCDSNVFFTFYVCNRYSAVLSVSLF